MILITGANGQLGHDLAIECEKRGLAYVKADSQDMDITDASAVRDYFSVHPFKSVLHCAAYTAVDAAEDEVEKCRAVNVEGTRNLAMQCIEKDIKFLYVSTDYVFDGTKEGFYETFDDAHPKGVYGQSKYDGERVVQDLLKKFFIVRISWVFGLNGKNFVKTMLRIGKDKPSVNVVADQYGSPTYTRDVARLMVEMIQTEKYGIYHATNEKDCSWAQFAQAIFEKAGYRTKVNFIPSSEYPTKAKRPMNSKMSKSALDLAGFSRLPDWQDALDRYLAELKENGELQ